MDKFPQMLFRAPGLEQIHGGYFDTTVVSDANALEAALADGWHESTPEAQAAYEKTDPTTANGNKDKADDSAPPTRAELEQKAHKLGIEFSPNIGDAKLAERIAAKLKG